jgi:hypothetical protein
LSSRQTCGTTTITSQSDADALTSACPTITGDIILATNVTSTISLDGIQVITGNLTGGSCGSTCATFTSLSSSTLTSVSQNFTLEALPSITTIFFPQLKTVGGLFYLDSLPSLNNLSTSLSSAREFHIVSAPILNFVDFQSLNNLTGSSFILRDIPGIQKFTLNQASHIKYLEFSGASTSESVEFFLGEDSATLNIDILNITGCWYIGINGDLNVGTAIFSNNVGVFGLDLTLVKVSSNLTIVDNSDLSNLTLPTDMSIPYIQIQNNAIEGRNITSVSGPWPWGLKNMTSVLLNGEFVAGFL